jgi:chromosome segregation ATPase
MPDTALHQIIAQAAADPGIRHQAVKDAHRLARQFISLLIATEDLAEAADIETARREAQAKVDALSAEAAGIEARVAAETAAARQEAEAAVRKLRAEAGKLGDRVAGLQSREQALTASLPALQESVKEAEGRLDALSRREIELRPIVEQAEQAEGRLATANAVLAQIEQHRAELLKSLGVA